MQNEMDTAWATGKNRHRKRDLRKILREDLHLRKIGSKWLPHALTEVTSICVFPYLFTIYQSSQKIGCQDLIRNPRIFVGLNERRRYVIYL